MFRAKGAVLNGVVKPIGDNEVGHLKVTNWYTISQRVRYNRYPQYHDVHFVMDNNGNRLGFVNHDTVEDMLAQGVAVEV